MTQTGTSQTPKDASASVVAQQAAMLKALPFFDQKKVVVLLDELPGMDVGARTANDQILMLLVSMCVLQERYGLAA